MIGRTAESLFWLGRYLERIENHARLIDVHYHMQAMHDDRNPNPWKKLIQLIGDESDFYKNHRSYNEVDVLHHVVFQETNDNAIFSCLSYARDNLQIVRERVPSELWDAVNGFYLWLKIQTVDDLLDYPHTFFEKIKNQAALFQGIAISTMLRGPEWHILQSGKFLERAENTLRIFKTACSDPEEPDAIAYDEWVALLKSVSGYEAFRKCLSNQMSINKMLEFLILHPLFPRSTRFSLRKLSNHLGRLLTVQRHPSPDFQHVMRCIGNLHAQLAYMEEENIAAEGVGSFLDSRVALCNDIGAKIEKIFFTKEASVLSF